MPESDREQEVTLENYGLHNAPRVQRRRRVRLGNRNVGSFGRDVENGTRCYVTVRDSEDHRYHGEDPWYDLSFEGDGYGLSIELFSKIDGRGIGCIYIVEEDTGDVYHFGFDQFVDGDPINMDPKDVPKGWEKDPQKVVAIDDAVEKWDDHARRFWAKNSAFQRASDL